MRHFIGSARSSSATVLNCMAIAFLCATVAKAENRDTAAAIERLAITDARTDSRGVLSVWNSETRRITRITPNGALTESRELPEATRVSVNDSGDIALITDAGTRVLIATWQGELKASIGMRDQVGDLTWLDDRRIAVTPTFVDHRVEVWDSATGKLLSRVGHCAAIVPPRTGVVPARATLIRYNGKRNEIVTLDAYRGDLIVFSSKGDVLRRASLTHPDLARNEAATAQRDREARTSGESLTPLVWLYPKVTVTPDGTVWVGESSDNAHNVTVVKLQPNGKVSRSTAALARCAALRTEAWGSAFVFYRAPVSPLGQCTEVKGGLK